MKKQFAIKAVQEKKNVVIAAAKHETSDLLKLLNFSVCCDAWDGGRTRKAEFQTVFSL